MVEVEKALLTYSMQNALKKAKSDRLLMKSEQRPKELITIMDALSKETDPLLNTLWTNLLCSELTNQNSHPFFISVLQSLSRKDAEILSRLHDYDATGEKKSNILISQPNIQYWVTENGAKPEEWTFSCSFLYGMGLASTVTPKESENHGTVILYRTDVGRSFLEAVTS
jgi:ribosomal protein S16